MHFVEFLAGDIPDLAGKSSSSDYSPLWRFNMPLLAGSDRVPHHWELTGLGELNHISLSPVVPSRLRG